MALGRILSFLPGKSPGPLYWAYFMEDSLMADSAGTRCFGGPEEPLMMRYHDEEWGMPLHDDLGLFEFLILEGAQAGLSWQTILKKREGYRKAFDGFDPVKVAAYDDAERERLLADPGIVRNRLKIAAAIDNARRFLEVQREFGSFDAYIWGFTGHKTLRKPGELTMDDMPSQTPESEAMYRDLKKRGFRFVGPTICYAFMQATGMVNNHISDCFLAPRG